jgi:hypothetical protein
VLAGHIDLRSSGIHTSSTELELTDCHAAAEHLNAAGAAAG